MIDNKEQLRPFLRVFNTDLIGGKPIGNALLKIKGVGFTMANSVCNVLSIDKNVKAGLLTDADARKIEEAIKTKMPNFTINRRGEFTTNENKHLVGGDLIFEVDNDIKI